MIKKTFFRACIFLIFTYSHFVTANVLVSYDFKHDLYQTFNLTFSGLKHQFLAPTNGYSLIAAAPIITYSFDQDKRILNVMKNKKKFGAFKIASDLAILANFPFLSYGLYRYSVTTQNEKLAMFAMEYTATLYGALLETWVLSMMDVHKRPDDDNLSTWETAFRGKSSFPSGHTIPFAALTFKTLEYYGPYAAILPFGLTCMVGYERVQGQKHYLSDVVASLFISFWASEGVRAAANYNNKSAWNNFILKHSPYIVPQIDSDTAKVVASFKF